MGVFHYYSLPRFLTQGLLLEPDVDVLYLIQDDRLASSWYLCILPFPSAGVKGMCCHAYTCCWHLNFSPLTH